jgi:hypothetical protein
VPAKIFGGTAIKYEVDAAMAGNAGVIVPIGISCQVRSAGATRRKVPFPKNLPGTRCAGRSSLLVSDLELRGTMARNKGARW